MIDVIPAAATSQPLSAATKTVDGLLATAIAAHRALDFGVAEAAYRNVLHDEPEHADAHHNLGVLLAVQLLRPLEALPHFEAALNADAERSQFWFSYIDGLVRCQHFPWPDVLVFWHAPCTVSGRTYR